MEEKDLNTYIDISDQTEYAQADPVEEPEIQVDMQELIEPAPEKKKSGGLFKKILLAVVAIACAMLVVVISCVASVAVCSIVWNHKYKTMNQAYSNRIDVLEQQLEGAGGQSSTDKLPQEPVTDQMLPAQVYERCVNSVVAIKSVQQVGGYFGQTTEGYSTGSGVILSQDGYIATNYHVVEGGTRLTVTTYDDQEYTAELVGHDAGNDIAVLKIQGENFPCASIGSSDSLLVGDKVAAIGNPLGDLTATMTVGYISAKDRLVNTDGTSINMMQTDAAINSGNSGGPLFDMYGNVVGITTAKYSGTSNSGASIEGIGFAIPIDDVVDIIDDLMNYGYVTGAYLGIYVREMDPDVAQTYGLPLGVRVEELMPGYCAEEAGLQVGDIITNLGGHKVESMADLSRALRKLSAGEQTTITVFRSGAEVHLEITLSEKPVETVQTPEETVPQNGDYDFWYDYFFGD